jgi:cytidine deaminase|tara:strand:+ start:452 stop:772 length:321 start_codon:yes stop_codon:yes gene_type:complete
MAVLHWSQLYLDHTIFYAVGVNQYNIDGKYSSLHAEVDAVNKLKKSEKNKRVNMIVFRVNKQGDICMSKPCINCMKVIKKELKRKNYKCPIIYYTEQDGSINYLYI